MSVRKKHNVDTGRRRFLVAATTTLGGIGIMSTAIPFIASMNPSAAVRNAGSPVDVDISKLEPGQLITVAWRSRPVWILRRTRDALGTLSTLDSRLADPHSLQPQQLPACQNEYRSIKPEYFVAVGICTHLGCVPTFRPDAAAPDLGPDWVGGFFCPCHGSRYDLAGRVFKNSPAPLNLPVPPYHYVTDALLRVGETAGGKEQQWQPATW
jgi:ubiquinol-cytochrome c reductase iron-sulfur subunit